MQPPQERSPWLFYTSQQTHALIYGLVLLFSHLVNVLCQRVPDPPPQMVQSTVCWGLGHTAGGGHPDKQVKFVFTAAPHHLLHCLSSAPLRSAVAFISQRSGNPTVNCTYQGTRMHIPLNHQDSPWKNWLPWNKSLVPKRWGTTALGRPLTDTSLFTWAFIKVPEPARAFIKVPEPGKDLKLSLSCRWVKYVRKGRQITESVGEAQGPAGRQTPLAKSSSNTVTERRRVVTRGLSLQMSTAAARQHTLGVDI